MKLVTLIAEERGRSQKPAYDSTDEATSTYPDAKSSDSSGKSSKLSDKENTWSSSSLLQRYELSGKPWWSLIIFSRNTLFSVLFPPWLISEKASSSPVKITIADFTLAKLKSVSRRTRQQLARQTRSQHETSGWQ
ncbi:hypothetical protein F2Q69_00023644 [Brassica cretica]|uniref:Uncharacterized protein n=1 Tax=Brassica cretica TaxID=69181 RepID=A0A8S9QTU6_BRACR|nr:hypothetical protein F2Q69_00023644 [Brassica cretica]